MKRHYERLINLITTSNPLDLDAWCRSLLIQFFFHVSDRNRIEIVGAGKPLLNLLTPTHFKGRGLIRLSNTTVFGVPRSPGSHSASYIESRTDDSLIDIGPGTVFNNRCVLISEGGSIRIGANCLIGPELHVMDSNSHDLLLESRRMPDPKPVSVEIGSDVFIGSRVTILKGVQIGNGCIVAAGSVLQPRFKAPALSIIAGNPAVIVGKAKSNDPTYKG